TVLLHLVEHDLGTQGCFLYVAHNVVLLRVSVARPAILRERSADGKQLPALRSNLQRLPRGGGWPPSNGRSHMLRVLALALSFALLSPTAWGQAESGALKRIKDTGTINLGYRDHAMPFSFRGTDGKPAGYSVDLCSRIANAIMSELKVKSLKVNWVPLTP